MGLHVEHRGEDEGLLHPDGVQAFEGLLRALLAGEVRVRVQRILSTL